MNFLITTLFVAFVIQSDKDIKICILINTSIFTVYYEHSVKSGNLERFCCEHR